MQNIISTLDRLKTPVFINNFNRLTMLQALLRWLEKVPTLQPVILDNASTYRPLIDFYRHLDVPVIYLGGNLGHLSLYKSGLLTHLRNDWYVYTDPDVVPMDECPLDAIDLFRSRMSVYPQLAKVGFGIYLDDIPDHFPLKKKVLEWERRFTMSDFDGQFYAANIDTGFALYNRHRRPFKITPALRSKYPYLMRHLPWYTDFSSLDEEEYFYLRTTECGDLLRRAITSGELPVRSNIKML